MPQQEQSSPSSISDGDFLEQVITAYQQLYDEIEEGERAEHDLMPRLVRHLFLDALGWDASDYTQEDDWNDLRFLDSDRHPVIIVEGKRRDVDAEDGIDQAFRYASETSYARYLIATNVDQMLVYRRCSDDEADETRHGVNGKLLADINFEAVVNKASGSALADELSLDERQNIQQLIQLRKQEVSNPNRYDNFEIHDRQDVATDEGFRNLIQSLSTCLDEYLMPYTLAAFDEYEERYEEYISQAEDLEQQIERLRDEGHEGSEIAELEVELGNLREEYAQYREFHSDYETWVNLSQRQENDKEDNKRIFCRESVYVQINKILLIRIAEDQGLTNRMISNGGVTDYFEFWENYSRYTKHDYSDLFDFASQELSEVYDHLYTQQIFDWPLKNGEELDEVLQKTLWHLNHYEFSDVSRDVLGHLYEEHLDPQERKELGEFYTPTSIVDFILDQVGYTSDEPLELPEYDILDPACGSGTFLVRATSRLRERLDNKGVGPKESLDIIQDRIHGLDINPFATHICEMNLLFQVIDLYREVKDEDEDYTLDRFRIYQTDSLRTESQTNLSSLHSNVLQRKYQEEKQQASQTKLRDDYGFVVGNPPYVRVQNLPEGPAREDYDEYFSAHYNYDLYCLFVERAANWLDNDGQLGLIISNKFVQSRYGEKLRQFAPINYKLETLIDFGSVDVFRSAKAFPLVITGKRINKEQSERSPDEFIISDDYRFTFGDIDAEIFPELLENELLRGWDDVDDNGDGPDTPTIPEFLNAVVPEEPGETPPDTRDVLDELGIGSTQFESGLPIDVYPVSSDMISDGDWRFVSAREETAMKALEEGGRKLETYCDDENVERGLRTGDNNAFVVNEATIDEYDMEDELVHPLVGGKQVERWYSPWEDRYVIYTRNDTDIDSYPNIKSYLEEHKDSLEDRWCVDEGGEPWFAIDKTKSPEMFERKKIVTPDIVLYNNFWLDESKKFYCLNTCYYVLSNGDASEEFLLGVLNSNAVQFYYRRIAPTYKDEFLRYISEYLKEIPIPDPEECEREHVSTIEKLASDLQDRVSEYHEAKDIKENPELVFEQEDIDRESLSLAGYVNSMNLSDGKIGDPYLNHLTLQLNVQDSIEFTSEAAAEAFRETVEILGFESVEEISEAQLPRTESALQEFVDTYDGAAGSLDSIEQDIKDLESELNEVVYAVFGVDDETREYIEQTVKTPTTPVRPKAMSDSE
ncbi:Eco57I restriction-modification methylase domain-containing protein [Halosimplex halobium]|uniref:Eco57I restriction-modification methylase domain-containing protein n=1 Tax=Halosimplex halobium TaxID=3396618 RepID=UPI003F57F717